MADSTNDAILFEDQFEITAKDHKKYDRAARLSAQSHDHYTTMELDINTELLNINPGDNMEVCLASTLNLDGSRDDDKGWRDLAKANVRTLADAYDYVCYGKVYKFEDGKAEKTLKAYVSFGGLLMALEGPDKRLTPMRVDHVYLLIKK